MERGKTENDERERPLPLTTDIDTPLEKHTPDELLADAAPLTDGEMYERIQRRAYDLYLSRGGAHGSEMSDWLQAEREIRGTRVSDRSVEAAAPVRDDAAPVAREMQGDQSSDVPSYLDTDVPVAGSGDARFGAGSDSAGTTNDSGSDSASDAAVAQAGTANEAAGETSTTDGGGSTEAPTPRRSRSTGARKTRSTRADGEAKPRRGGRRDAPGRDTE